MKVPFDKKSTSPEEQVAILKSRGLVITDTDAAQRYFLYHNYYHVSGYVYYFEIKDRVRTHVLARPVSFDEIISLVSFDCTLRKHCLHAIFAIEAAFRCVISGEISLALGPFALENAALFREPLRHSMFMDKLYNALNDHRKEPFIFHFLSKYTEPMPPAWVMIELLTLGNISYLYSQITTDMQKRIARHFNVDHIILVSWLKALTELRNTCAHHARLFNKVFVNYPKQRHADAMFPLLSDQRNRLGSFIPLISHLLTVIGERCGWTNELHALVTKNKLIKPEDMGLRTWELYHETFE